MGRGMTSVGRSAATAWLAGAAIGWAASPAAAQSASEIVDRMLSEYERRAEGIDDFTLVQQTIMGFESVSYFEKEMVDGRPVFRPRSNSIAGMGRTEMSENRRFDDIYAMGDEFGRRARYRGVQRVDDYDLHVLEVDDFSGLDFDPELAPDSDFRPKSGTFFLDVDTYVPRRIEFVGELRNEEGTHDITSTVDMGDYRETDGMLHPWRTVITIDGVGSVIDEETRAQFDEMQRELERMPPEQRAMVERMMAGQMEQIRSMMSGGDASLTFEVLVTEVRVNAGPPAR